MVSHLTPFIDALPIPLVRKPVRSITVPLKEVTAVKLHADLPLTRMWTYDGTFPGPTIEVRSKQSLVTRWKNQIPAGSTLPISVAEVAYDDQSPDPIPQNGPGSAAANRVHGTADLTAHTVVHLHGGQHGYRALGGPVFRWWVSHCSVRGEPR